MPAHYITRKFASRLLCCSLWFRLLLITCSLLRGGWAAADEPSQAASAPAGSCPSFVAVRLTAHDGLKSIAVGPSAGRPPDEILTQIATRFGVPQGHSAE